MDVKIKPSDLRLEAQRLIAAGKMPQLEDLLGAVADAREKYKPQLEESQKEKAE
jgi:hypothetical protein